MFPLVLADLGLQQDRLVGVKFVHVKNLSLLKPLLKLLADRDDVSVLNNVFGELLEELIFRHAAGPRIALEVPEDLEFGVVLDVFWIVILVCAVHWLEWDAIRELFLQIIREEAVENV